MDLAILYVQVFGGRSWSLSGMLKDRGHKGSWKGGGHSNNHARAKKKSYGNIHSINDRGIHEIQGRKAALSEAQFTQLRIYHVTNKLQSGA